MNTDNAGLMAALPLILLGNIRLEWTRSAEPPSTWPQVPVYKREAIGLQPHEETLLHLSPSWPMNLNGNLPSEENVSINFPS